MDVVTEWTGGVMWEGGVYILRSLTHVSPLPFLHLLGLQSLCRHIISTALCNNVYDRVLSRCSAYIFPGIKNVPVGVSVHARYM